MDSSKQDVDLEKELTCSICTEVLYQPLTLLDCLHTFCGACLKEWFSWQYIAARNSGAASEAGTTPYTCPSCRAPVRGTKHNATVTTLLEMFLKAHPAKGRTTDEQEEQRKKYAPGDVVMPKLERREKSSRQRRADEEDRRLMDDIRELSLREVGVEAGRTRRRRDDSRSDHRRTRSSRDHSMEPRNTDGRERRRRQPDSENEARERRRRHRADSTDPALGRSGPTLRPDTGSENRRRRRSEEDVARRNDETSRRAARQIEHQSSLRSLISSSDLDAHEMEEEIMRQIHEEGLLDGIDLDNIDVSQEDQISERIAQAFRRRQEAASAHYSRRNYVSPSREARSRPSSESREGSRNNASRSPARRTHPPVTTTGRVEEPARTSSSSLTTYLEVGDEGHRRRRTTSRSRSATTPLPASIPDERLASRSDSTIAQVGSLALTGRPLTSTNSRSNTDPSGRRGSENNLPPLRQDSQSTSFSFAARTRNVVPTNETSSSTTRADAPASVFVPSSAPSALIGNDSSSSAPLSPNHQHQTTGAKIDRLLMAGSASRPGSSSSATSRQRLPLYPEPSIICSKCSKPHIEYELHYNCYICSSGNWNICLSCFRNGSGCHYWFGFGSSAWAKWEKQILAGELPQDAKRPHMLTANRYLPPKSSSGGADGRRTLTHDDPEKRLQSGAFCASCSAWANMCYWRCDICNEDDWGFCNLCVNQGRCCTHPLLPLRYNPSEDYEAPSNPSVDQQPPPSATLLTGPNVVQYGGFKPLTFSTKCNLCRYPIQPSSSRYHCFQCSSSMPGTQPGDYDICTNCYSKLVTSRRISAENGTYGWRRCLAGHRMVIVGFEDNGGGQRRVVVNDLVGGVGLEQKPYSSNTAPSIPCMIWSWADGTICRLVTNNVSDSAPAPGPAPADGLTLSTRFPPDGGLGMRAVAPWPWYPKDGEEPQELMFPRGAEIREIVDVNGDWYWGTYAGKGGLLPAPYVRVFDRVGV